MEEQWFTLLISQELQASVSMKENNHGVSGMIPAIRFSWEITNVDSVFTNGVARINDLTKEAMLQAIIDKDLRFLTVRFGIQYQSQKQNTTCIKCQICLQQIKLQT